MSIRAIWYPPPCTGQTATAVGFRFDRVRERKREREQKIRLHTADHRLHGTLRPSSYHCDTIILIKNANTQNYERGTNIIL